MHSPLFQTSTQCGPVGLQMAAPNNASHGGPHMCMYAREPMNAAAKHHHLHLAQALRTGPTHTVLQHTLHPQRTYHNCTRQLHGQRHPHQLNNPTSMIGYKTHIIYRTHTAQQTTHATTCKPYKTYQPGNTQHLPSYTLGCQTTNMYTSAGCLQPGDVKALPDGSTAGCKGNC